MSILRVKRTPGYTSVPNRTLHDKRLSFRARGVLTFLLAHPDDWEISTGDLSAYAVEGRDAIRSALDELRKLGYVEQFKESYVDTVGRTLWRTVTQVTDAVPETDSQGSVTDAWESDTEDGFPGPAVQSSSSSVGSRDLEELRSSRPARKRARGKNPVEAEEDPQSAVLASLQETPTVRAKRDPFEPRSRQKRLSPAENLVRYWASAAAPHVSEKISPTNQRELKGAIQRWLNDGTDYSVVVSMIAAYWEPTFQRSPNVVAWKDFLAKRDQLAAAGRKEASLKQAEDDRYDESKW